MSNIFYAISIDRWVAACVRCGLRFMLEGADPTKALASFDHSFCIGKGNLTLARVVWHKKRRSREHCRMGERLPSPRLPEPKPGECSWMCLNSQSPRCFCEGCEGKRHGSLQVIDPLQPTSGAYVIDMLIARTPDREVARRARRST